MRKIREKWSKNVFYRKNKKCLHDKQYERNGLKMFPTEKLKVSTYQKV